MESFYLKIFATDRVFYDGECYSLIVPSVSGQYGIMAQHCNCVVAVTSGTAKIKTQSEEIVAFFSNGIAKSENGNVVVMVESAERAEDIDEAHALKSAQEAREDLQRSSSKRNARSAEIKMARALNRLKTKKYQ